MKNNALNWFEIYVSDLDRARKFYETILDAKLRDAGMDGCSMSIFPYDNMKGVGGAKWRPRLPDRCDRCGRRQRRLRRHR